MRILSFRLETPFLGKFGPKTKIVSLSWNLVLRPIQICRIQWCSISFFDQKYHFLGKFGPKNPNCRLSSNLVLILIWICKMQWWCSLFPFLTENTFFWAILIQKIKIVSLSSNSLPKLNSNMHNSMVMLTFSVFDQTKNTLFAQI